MLLFNPSIVFNTLWRPIRKIWLFVSKIGQSGVNLYNPRILKRVGTRWTLIRNGSHIRTLSKNGISTAYIETLSRQIGDRGTIMIKPCRGSWIPACSYPSSKLSASNLSNSSKSFYFLVRRSQTQISTKTIIIYLFY